MASRRGVRPPEGWARDRDLRLEKARAETAMRAETNRRPESSKRSSLTSSSSAAPRIPILRSSIFSRGKQSGAKVQNVSTGITGYPPREMRLHPGSASKKDFPLSSIPSSSHSLGLGIQTPQISSSLQDVQSADSGTSMKHNNFLRQKGPLRDPNTTYARSESTTSSQNQTYPSPEPSLETVSSPGGYSGLLPQSMMGMTMPPVPASTSYPSMRPSNPVLATSNSRVANYVSSASQKESYNKTNVPSAMSFANSSSPSTHQSESPGPFSSRTSTPTSMSSQSPNVLLPSKSTLNPRQLSPTRSRPPITRRTIRLMPGQEEVEVSTSRTQGLSALRESLTSSSSSSTVKATERHDVTDAQRGSSTTRIPPPQPSPPVKRYPRTVTPKQAKGLMPPAISLPIASQNSVPFSISPVDSGLPGYDIGSSVPKGPPPRPIRDNNRVLDDSGPSPVIRSNLRYLATTGHKRRESADKVNADFSSAKSQYQAANSNLSRAPSTVSTASKPPSRLPSPSVSEQLKNAPAITKLRQVPSLQTRDIPPPVKKEPNSLSSGSSKSPSKFAFFSRSPKPAIESSSLEPSERQSRKGPAAGTGHEGYGKYARRGRSGSVSTNPNRARSTSAGSNGTGRPLISRKDSTSSRSEHEMDDFLIDRLEPVVIGGGGKIKENGNSGSDLSKTSSGESSSGAPSIVTSGAGLTTTPLGGYIADGPWDSTDRTANLSHRGSRSLPQEKDSLAGMDLTKAIDVDQDLTKRPSLATRRSLHRSELSSGTAPMMIPPPIDTRIHGTSPSLNSYDTIQSILPRTNSSLHLGDDISEGREGNWLKATKKPKTRSPGKWNFFERATATRKQAKSEHLDDTISIQELPVKVSKLPEARSIAYYAMMDSTEQSEFEGEAAGELLSNVETDSSSRDLDTVQDSMVPEQASSKQERKLTMLLPSPPIFVPEFSEQQQPSSPAVSLRQGKAFTTDAPTLPPAPAPKVSRLPQVGRIPRVVSKRDRPHKPPPQSFSRPFNKTPMVKATLPNAIRNLSLQPDVAKPVLDVRTSFVRPQPVVHKESLAFSAPASKAEYPEPPEKNEFLAFPPRKNSEVSVSSSSGTFSFAAFTAVPPKPETPLSEDEVWNEYDELLDHVISPAPSQGSRQSRPLITPDDVQTSTTTTFPQPQTFSPPESIKPELASLYVTSDHMHGFPSPPRGPQLLSSNPSAGQPSTPMSFSDFIAGYGDQYSADGKATRRSTSPGSHCSGGSQESRIQRSGSHKDSFHNSQLIAQRIDENPDVHTDLRLSALMASRWLSFGRVLFSPAQTEIAQNQLNNCVLVLDGLDNDDWSFYCALTYPDLAVYNLSPFLARAATDDRKRSPSGVSSPPTNHHQVYHRSISHSFPFPKAFFSAVIYRFPIAKSDSAYQNQLSECKRVLRPGGYLELSMLDLDLVNMGNRARRAVRDLKLRMHIADPNVSLKPASDNIQKMLSKKGFENLNRCIVGVPIAGSVSDSRAGSFSDIEDGENNGLPGLGRASLGDVLKREASERGNAGITKMVTNVGRWWYSRCYEEGVLGDDDQRDERSIWSDAALLKECEARGTGFKMLICYAQKPHSKKGQL